MAGTPSDTEASRKLHVTHPNAHRLHRFSGPELRCIGRRKSAVIEASLSPIKYAIFSVLGSLTLQWGGFLGDLNPTSWSDAKYGFVGGIILVILFFIRLLLTSETEDHLPNSTLRNQLTLIIKEATCSAAAGCIGRLTVGGTRRGLLFMAVAGAAGALTSFVILYLLLGVVLATIWVVLRCGAVRKRL